MCRNTTKGGTELKTNLLHVETSMNVCIQWRNTPRDSLSAVGVVWCGVVWCCSAAACIILFRHSQWVASLLPSILLHSLTHSHSISLRAAKYGMQCSWQSHLRTVYICMCKFGVQHLQCKIRRRAHKTICRFDKKGSIKLMGALR